MIWHRLTQRQAQKASKRQPIQQGVLKSRIGQPIPLLQQQRLEQRQRRVSWRSHRPASQAAQQRFYRTPIDQFRNSLQRRIAPSSLVHQFVRKAQLTDLTLRHQSLQRILRLRESFRVTSAKPSLSRRMTAVGGVAPSTSSHRQRDRFLALVAQARMALQARS